MKSKKIKPLTILGQLLLALYALASLYPIIWMFFYSFKNNDEIFITNPFGFPTQLRFENYVTALTAYNVPVYFGNSVITTVVTVIFAILFALMFSYAITRMRFRGQSFLRGYILLGLFIPIQVIMIPLAILVRNLGIANTRTAVIVPYIAFNLAFATMVFCGFFRSLPKELEEAACMDGANIFRTFFSIIVPSIKSVIATVMIFISLSVWNEFTMALILISKENLKTLPLGLLFFQGEFTTNWGAMGAAMVIASLPTILIYVFLSDQVLKAMTVGSAVK